ncbi:hypothetical protein GW17_00035225 [Ensete ventricosum]|nr:hypothetical protein GW17_00035225 [Ensete ventricosum]RZS07177.1 hypothetical protein BHM03_00037966 [Ensete ventricosum]
MTSGRASVEEDSERFPGTTRPLRCDRFNATASRLTTSDWAGGFHVRLKASRARDYLKNRSTPLTGPTLRYLRHLTQTANTDFTLTKNVGTILQTMHASRRGCRAPMSTPAPGGAQSEKSASSTSLTHSQATTWVASWNPAQQLRRRGNRRSSFAAVVSPRSLEL